MIKLNIKNILEESYVLIFNNLKKLIAPTFFLSTLMLLSFIFFEWYFASDLAKIIKSQFFLVSIFFYMLLFVSIFYLLIIPVIYFNIILSNHQVEKISHFLINPYQTINYYLFQWLSPFILGGIIIFFFKALSFSNDYIDTFQYLFLIIITYFLVRISFSPIITLNLLCKADSIKTFDLSKVNSYLISWKITKDNTLKIFIIMFLGNLPITLFLIGRYIYLVEINSKITFPLLPSSIVIGGDNFIIYILTGMSDINFILNFFTFLFLVCSILISISIRTVILEKLEKNQ